MKRRDGGGLVDVASLGVSVINRDRRMEGGEELRRSCSEEEETNGKLAETWSEFFSPFI